MSQSDLLRKYDVPAPRYTSYPTVPYWEDNMTSQIWIDHLTHWFRKSSTSWSMYVHVPFCESLCTFCGCNNAITKNHKVEAPYVQSLIQEFQTYLQKIPELAHRPLKHIHLGGGTPTFLSAPQLDHLMGRLFSGIQLSAQDFEASIEVDPRRTELAQLEVLRKHGFNRISLGVQDFNPEVQRLVNRIQPFDITKRITEESRRLGYESVNFDLIYGLAKQTPETMRYCVEKTIELRPDRIALYSFALVPWIKPAQRLFKDEDLPRAAEKRELYEISRELLLGSGYIEVGMDHFALPSDRLAKALHEKSLHRNFMGYTDQKTDVMLGIGVSAISETPQSFHQNEKILPKYEEMVARAQVATLRGHSLNDLDQMRRQQILQLLTQQESQLLGEHEIQDAQEFLKEMIADGLAKISGNKLYVTKQGHPFMRNIAMFFDDRLRKSKPETKTFSQAI